MNNGERNIMTVVPAGLTGQDAPSPARYTPPIPATSAPEGFHAELNGASLWDLVQMECLAQSNGVFQVSGDGRVGYLYFSRGRVVHAVTSRLSGQEAALEILSWTHGAFGACNRVWPSVATIETSHEALILMAAKRRDEASASNLVAFRGREARPDDVVTESYEIDFQEVGEDGARQDSEEEGQASLEEDFMADTQRPIAGSRGAPGTTGVTATTQNDPLPDFSVMIRVAPGGAIVRHKGGNEELAGVVAYAQRLVELVGELLGLDKFVALECVFKAGDDQVTRGPPRALLFTEANGDTVLLRPRTESDLQPLRESLGL